MTYGPVGWGGPPPAPQPGVIPLRPLAVGDVLRGMFGTFGHCWRAVYGVTLAVTGGMLLVTAAAVGLPLLGFWDTLRTLDARGSLPGDDVAALVVTGALVLLVLLCVGLYGFSVLTACYAVAVSHAALGSPVTFRGLWRQGRPRAWSVLGVQALTGLLFAVPLLLVYRAVFAVLLTAVDGRAGAGTVFAVVGAVLVFLALLVAGVFVSVRLTFAASAATLEQNRPVAALRRSWLLTRGSWWRIAGISLLVSLILSAVNQLLQTLVGVVVGAGMALSAVPGGDPSVAALVGTVSVAAVLTVAGYSLTMPLSYFATTLLYVDERIRRESLDLALAEAAGLPPHRPAG
jgi:hypothetical protein